MPWMEPRPISKQEAVLWYELQLALARKAHADRVRMDEWLAEIEPHNSLLGGTS